MEVRWQCLVDGNMDLVATSYDGKLAHPNQYNTEMGEVRRHDVGREGCLCSSTLPASKQAVKDGKFKTYGDSKVPVVDGTKAANATETALTAYVPVPKNPHGVNASPDGKYFICAGKLNPDRNRDRHGTVLKFLTVA